MYRTHLGKPKTCLAHQCIHIISDYKSCQTGQKLNLFNLIYQIKLGNLLN